MGRAKVAKDPAKPKGRMSAYAFFVQTCREEHRQKHPNETVEFAQFSRKCADRWKVIKPFYFYPNFVAIFILLFAESQNFQKY